MIFPLENNDNIKSTVLNFVSNRRIPHAILIESENADDKAALADFLANVAVCDGQNAPCNNCINCHQAQVHTHPDITYVYAADGKKNITVGQVRTIRADAFVKPHSANSRVFIIEDAHRLNEQAQNALLKILEEPPQSVVFILTVSSKTFLLDTIISRCVLLSLCSQSTNQNETKKMADEFLNLLISGNEYQMLKLLTPLEKNRNTAEEFFNALACECSKRLREGCSNARVFDSIFDDTKYYSDLLKTNINMSILLSLAVSKSKGHLDMR